MDGVDSHLKSLLPPTDFSRRGFVMTSLTAGFALAVQPVMAQTVITTDSAGLEAGEVKIPVSGGELPAYRAMPDKGGYWLIDQVRALPAERGGATPAAALTGFTGPEHRSRILRAGFQYHIEKPVALEELVRIVALLALKAHSPQRG